MTYKEISDLALIVHELKKDVEAFIKQAPSFPTEKELAANIGKSIAMLEYFITKQE